MKSSIEITNITKALVKAQAEFPVIPFDSDNPYFKSRYASLAAIVAGTRPVLVANGLYVLQFPVSVENGNVGVTSRLLHESGEWFEETITIPLKGTSDKTQIAQVAGIDITYLRRYSYSSILGIVTEEDTDGGVFDGYEKPPRQLKAKKTFTKKSKREPVEDEGETLNDMLLDFDHKWNKARSLGNAEADLPKIKDTENEKEVLEKLAELEIILKESLGE